MFRLILGSRSPRRKEILSFFNIPFTQAVPGFDEESIKFKENPKDFVCQLSVEKANSLRPFYKSETILTADSIVYCNGKVFGKPKDRAEAFTMLETLSGKWHSVFTG